MKIVDPKLSPMSDQSDAPKDAEAAPKKKRRILTPDERISMRKAEIAEIEERQRERVLKIIDEAREALEAAATKAEAAGMAKEVGLCRSAILALDDEDEEVA